MTRAKLRRGIRKRRAAREARERRTRRVWAASLPPPDLSEEPAPLQAHVGESETVSFSCGSRDERSHHPHRKTYPGSEPSIVRHARPSGPGPFQQTPVGDQQGDSHSSPRHLLPRHAQEVCLGRSRPRIRPTPRAARRDRRWAYGMSSSAGMGRCGPPSSRAARPGVPIPGRRATSIRPCG